MLDRCFGEGGMMMMGINWVTKGWTVYGAKGMTSVCFCV